MITMIKKLLLHSGYNEIKEEIYEYDFEAGSKILTCNDTNNIVGASIDQDKILISKQYWICPYCNATSYIKNKHHWITQQDFDDNFTQISMFNGGKVTLFNNDFSAKVTSFECKCCGKTIERNGTSRELTISTINKSINVIAVINDIGDLIKSRMIDGNLLEIMGKLPLKETLTFDFGEHKIFDYFETADGELLGKAELKNLKYNTIADLIDDYASVQETLMDAIKEIWMPNDFEACSVTELDAKMMQQLVQFVGYPKSFYDEIPYSLDNDKEIYTSFKAISNKMQNRNNLVLLLKQSTLPNGSALKRIMFEKPSLFFYLNEIEDIYNIIENYDYLTSILQHNHRTNLLAMVHTYPCLLDFIKRFCEVRGIDKLAVMINNHYRSIISYALYYCSLRNEIKCEEEKKWTDNDFFKSCHIIQYPSVPFSLPVKKLDSSYELSIGDYEFITIKNMDDYKRAGTQLNNCMVSYDYNSNPCVVVKNTKTKMLIAAIEIEGNNYVVQAFAENNNDITEYPSLHNAILDYFNILKLDYSDIDI